MINENNYAKAYTEILKIIELLPDSEYKKIPNSIIEEFQKKSDKEYEFNINSEEDFENKELQKETEYIMYGLYKNYLSNNEEREQLKQAENKVNIALDESKRLKYNPDNIFNNKKNKEFNSGISNEVAIAEYNEPLLKKIWIKILNLLKK